MPTSLPFPPHQPVPEPPEVHPGVRHQLANPSSDGSLLLDLRSSTDYLIRELGSTHPVDVLPATYAPPGSVGLALVVPGRVRHGDHPDVPVGDEVRAAQIVYADGASSAVVQLSGHSMIDHRPAPSRLGDLLFRMLRLPTPRLKQSAGIYWAAVWLNEIFGSTRESDFEPPVGVAEMVSWHPAIDPREVIGLSQSELEELVVQRHRDHTSLATWSAIRASARAGWLELGRCPPPVADWLDDDSFGRWLMSDLPSVAELAEVGRHLLSSECRAVVLTLLTDIVDRTTADPSAPQWGQ